MDPGRTEIKTIEATDISPRTILDTHEMPVVKGPERDRYDQSAPEKHLDDILSKYPSLTDQRALAINAISEFRAFKEGTEHGEEYHDEYHALAFCEGSARVVEEAKQGLDPLGLTQKIEARGLELGDLQFAMGLTSWIHDLANAGDMEVSENGEIKLFPHKHPTKKDTNQYRSGAMPEKGVTVEDLVIQEVQEIVNGNNFPDYRSDAMRRFKMARLVEDLVRDTKFPTPENEKSEFNQFVQLCDQSLQAWFNKKGVTRTFTGLIREWQHEGKLPPINSTQVMTFAQDRLEKILNPTGEGQSQVVDQVKNIVGPFPEEDTIRLLKLDSKRPQGLIEFADYLESILSSNVRA